MDGNQHGKLVVTRRPGEEIYITTPIGEVIVITVSQVSGKNVRLAFAAPDSVIIDRKERYERRMLGK